jgi:hypothetical protein
MGRASSTAVHLLWNIVPFKSVARPVARRLRSSRLLPLNWLPTLRACRILGIDYGHMLSAARLRSVDADGEPVAWITYPALEFLKQLDFSDKIVFEYGCGGSTIFWSRIALQVDSVEDNPAFHDEFHPLAPRNCNLLLERYPDRYVHAPERRPGGYDVIVIDGHSRARCAEIAPRCLKSGGAVILDNAEWFADASATLRAADLIEVDFAGLAPINDFISTTSFFLHRDFRGKPKADRQPVGAIGSRPKPNFRKITGPGPTH